MRRHVTPADSTSAARPRTPRQDVESLGWAQSHAFSDAVDVSVCIASWNCKELLRNCLRSLLEAPQGVTLEVIVVDNASTDGAAEMVAIDFPEVTLIRNSSNFGFSRANNRAAAAARGKYLFFLNNDTVVPADSLRRLFDFAEAHPEVGMVGPRLRDPSGRLQISYRQLPSLWALLHRTLVFRWTGLLRRAYRQYRRQSFDPRTRRPVQVLMGAAVFLSRDMFAACGRWDEGYAFGGEDIDLSLRVNQLRPIVYLPSVEITHHGRVSSRQNIGYTQPNVAIGYARYLRAAGNRPLALAAYKLLVTLDAPVQLTVKGVQLGWRRLRRQDAKATKTALALKGHWAFLTGHLANFWRA